MSVEIFNESSKKLPQSKELLKNYIEGVIQHEGKDLGEMNYYYIMDEDLLEINKEFLNKEYLTDVIAFDYSEDDLVSGDIYISIERVKENAKKYENGDFLKEFLRVSFHGLLHILGYRDKTDAEVKQMREKEEEYINMMYGKS